MVSRIQALSKEEQADNDNVYDMIEEAQDKYKIPLEFGHFIGLVGLFPPSRNIIKNWDTNEDVFIRLVKEQGKDGKDHFLQALVLYFIRKYNDQCSKFAPTFMKKLVDENILKEKFLIDWFDKNIRLDKDSGLYDKKAEKKFRDLVEKFIDWLR